MLTKIKKFKWTKWTIIASLLLFASCTDVLTTSDNVDMTNGVIEFKIENPSPPSRSKLITVNEYEVTGLLIVVTDPNNEEIQRINWSASENSKTYQIPVKTPGKHRVIVTHISNDNGKVVKAKESAYFIIRPMIITVVEIIPGFVGFINIDDSEREAINIVRNNILPVSLQESQAERYILRRTGTVLPSGTIIKEAIPEGANTNPETDLEVSEDSYIFLLDLKPNAFFEHPVQYIVVDKKGNSKKINAKWLPKVNDQVPETFSSDTPELYTIVDRNVTIEVIEELPMDWIVLNPDVLNAATKEAFLIVQGLTPNESLYTCSAYTYNNGYNFFNAYKSSLSTVVGLMDYDTNTVLTEIDSLAASYDTITLYIIAHGSVDGISLGGYNFYASQFADTFSSHPDVNFNFLLGSCHSGSFIDDLSAIPNVNVVKTASSTTESAFGDEDTIASYNDINPLDNGTEWTSSFLEAASIIVNNNDIWNTIAVTSSTYNVPATSVMLNEAGFLAVGINRGLPVSLNNYDLANITSWETPQHYSSWEF
jgi:hypothetical protein